MLVDFAGFASQDRLPSIPSIEEINLGHVLPNTRPFLTLSFHWINFQFSLMGMR